MSCDGAELLSGTHGLADLVPEQWTRCKNLDTSSVSLQWAFSDLFQFFLLEGSKLAELLYFSDGGFSLVREPGRIFLKIYHQVYPSICFPCSQVPTSDQDVY